MTAAHIDRMIAAVPAYVVDTVTAAMPGEMGSTRPSHHLTAQRAMGLTYATVRSRVEDAERAVPVLGALDELHREAVNAAGLPAGFCAGCAMAYPCNSRKILDGVTS